MISSSPIRTKASRLKKMLPVNPFNGRISQYTLLVKSPTYIYCDDCVENIINDYEALVFFITNGFKPNWLPKDTFFNPESILLSLYSNYLNLFVEFIQSLKGDNNLLRRSSKLIDRNTFSSSYNFHLEVDTRADFVQSNIEWFFESSIVNGEK